MIKIFFLVLASLFSFQIIYQKGHRKLLWFVVGILFFPNSIALIDSPIYISFPRLLTYVIILTVLFNRNWWISFRHFPIRKPLIVLSIIILLIGLFDERLNPVLKIYRPVTIFCENFFLIFISFYFIRKIDDTFQFFKVILFSLLLFGIFGLINYYQHDNMYYVLLTKTYGAYDFSNVNMTATAERFRISSFAWHAIYYGLLLTIAILLSIFFLLQYPHQFKRKLIYYVLIILLLVNLFLVNSRTPLFALVSGFLIFFLWEFNNSTKLKAVVVFIAILFSVVVFIPKAKELLSASVETVSSQKQDFQEGSSLKMRLGQLRASISLFNQSPILGNGIYYIKESLGYNPDSKKNQSNKDLYGFESYIYLLLIEQGFFGIVGNVYFIMALFTFFIRSYKLNYITAKSISLLSISLLVSFLTFIVATGDMGSFTFFMLIIGVNIKTVMIPNKVKLIFEDNPLIFIETNAR